MVGGFSNLDLRGGFCKVGEELQSLVRAVYVRVSSESRCFEESWEKAGSHDRREPVEDESSVLEISSI